MDHHGGRAPQNVETGELKRMNIRHILRGAAALAAMALLLTACARQTAAPPDTESGTATQATSSSAWSTSKATSGSGTGTTDAAGTTSSEDTDVSGSASIPVGSASPSGSDKTTAAPQTSTKRTTTTRATTRAATTAPKPTVPTADSSKSMKAMAQTAYQDMLKNYWTGTATGGHIRKEDHGYVISESREQTMIWAHATMIFAMDTLYSLTGDVDIKNRITAQWRFTKANFSWSQLVTPGTAPNIALDDAGWDAMVYMIFYRYTGDRYALDAAGELLRNSYNYWKDGDVKNGLWYPQLPPSHGGDATTRFKSLYSVALLSAAFDYCEATGDFSGDIWKDTMDVYNWNEANLKRSGQDFGNGIPRTNDKLYFCDFNVDRVGRTETYGPDGGLRPNDIKEANSVGHLGGNMGMAAFNARLYRKTGDTVYLNRAIETARAITDGPYNKNGIYLNDRDAWTNGTFAKAWVEEVLTLPGIRDKDRQLVYGTARSIYSKARTADGYYSGSWTGSGKWERAGSVPEQIMTTSTSVSFIMAAALLEG